jgi:membrane protease YdiL (CAAX protease family)
MSSTAGAAAHPVAFMCLTGLSFGIVLASAAAAFALVQRKRFGDITGTWSWRRFALGAAICTGLSVLSAAADYTLAPRGFSLTAGSTTWAFVAAAALALCVQSFTEEFIFRGWLTQGLLLATRRPALASAGSGLLFGSLHLSNGVPQAVSAAFFGFVTSLIAIRTGGIALTFGLHFANNLFGAVAVVSSDDVFHGLPAVITQRTPQLTWFDVGFEMAGLALVLWLIVFRGSAPRRGASELAAGTGVP